MLSKIIQFKQNISIFKNMSDEEIAFVVRDVEFLEYSPGEIIIQQGDTDSRIFLLLSGECRVLVNNRKVSIINNRQTFGEFSPITKQKRSATIIANSATKVIAFDLALNQVEQKMKGFSSLYTNIINELFKKIDMANKRSNS